MTEEEWLSCSDPDPMLRFLEGKISERKLRLFAVACCRLVWDRIPNGESKHAVEVAEAFADRVASPAELEAAHVACHAARPAPPGEGDDAEKSAWLAALHCTQLDTKEAAFQSMQNACLVPLFVIQTAWCARTGEDELPEEEWFSLLKEERSRQIAILREVIGNPFRPVVLAPACLSWNDSTIPKLAQSIYDDRAFDRFPILADALEEAGCMDNDILNHCRQPGEHVRGCWVVDLLLGKR
jgi:hypothetical protein